jgi:hypothetical protein
MNSVGSVARPPSGRNRAPVLRPQGVQPPSRGGFPNPPVARTAEIGFVSHNSPAVGTVRLTGMGRRCPGGNWLCFAAALRASHPPQLVLHKVLILRIASLGIGFVSHILSQRRRHRPPCPPAPIPGRRLKIGFVSHNRWRWGGSSPVRSVLTYSCRGAGHRPSVRCPTLPFVPGNSLPAAMVTEAEAGPLMAKPSEVMVSYLRFHTIFVQ